MSSTNQFKCEQCGMTFGSQEELQTHSNKEHVGTVEDLPEKDRRHRQSLELEKSNWWLHELESLES